MRASLVLTLLLCAAPASASQVVLVPLVRDSISTETQFQPFGYGISHVGFDSSLDTAWEALLTFDLATALPPGAHVTAARLVMNELFELGLSDTPVDLHALTTAWAPGSASWLVPWQTPGGDFGPPLASAHPAQPGPTIFVSGAALVAQVQAWVDQPGSNLGLVVRDPTFFVQEVRYQSAQLELDFDLPCAPPQSYCVAAPNSSGAGARITGSGSTRIADNAFALTVSGGSPGATGWFFGGSTQLQLPFGDGFLCAGGELLRLGPALFADASGTWQRTFDFQSGSAAHIAAGSTWNFQLKYRNHVPGGAGFNLSDGLSVSFCP